MTTDTDITDDAQTYDLTVDPETIVNGIKINETPGEQRTVVFRPQVGDGYGEGTLRDVRGQHWDGDAPPQLRPKSFVREQVTSLAETKRDARQIAEEEGGDPEEAEQEAVELWEDQIRNWLQDQIVVEPRFPEETTTIYNIDYEGGE